MPSLNTHGGAWSNRQGMWPLAERRLVFTSKKEIVTQQWLENFNLLLNQLNEQQEGGIEQDMLKSTIDNYSQNEDSMVGPPQ